MGLRNVSLVAGATLAAATAIGGDHRFSAFAAYSRSTGKEARTAIGSTSRAAFAAPVALSGDGNGWHVTGEVVLTGYLDHKLSFIGDLSGHARDDGTSDDVAQLTALFGFRFQWRKERQVLRSYVQDVQGGPPRPVTPENVWTTAISPDGRWLATIQDGPEDEEEGRAAIELWPVEGGDPRPVRSSRPGDRPVAWTADGRALWVFRRGEVPAEVSVLEVETGRRRVWKTLTPPTRPGSIRSPTSGSRRTDTPTSTATSACCRSSTWSRACADPP